MAGHTPFRTLRDRLRANEAEATREQRAVVLRAMGTASVLSGLLDRVEPAALDQLGLVERIEENGVTVVTVADAHLSVLREGIEALGGRLEVRAVFPDQTIALIGCDPEATS
jgi:hypothetical protein